MQINGIGGIFTVCYNRFIQCLVLAVCAFHKLLHQVIEQTNLIGLYFWRGAADDEEVSVSKSFSVILPGKFLV